MVRSRIHAAMLGACALIAGASQAQAQEPFYKGKRLTVLVNFDAGSATDIEGARVRAPLRQAYRWLAQPDRAEHRRRRRHQRHALSRRGRAQGRHDDGLHHRHRLELSPASRICSASTSGPTSSSASSGGTAVYYMRTDVPPGIKTPADIVKAQGLVSGGVAATTGRDLGIRLTLDILGVPFKPRHRLSLRRAGAARVAAERNPSLCRHLARLSQRHRADAW